MWKSAPKNFFALLVAVFSMTGFGDCGSELDGPPLDKVFATLSHHELEEYCLSNSRNAYETLDFCPVWCDCCDESELKIFDEATFREHFLLDGGCSAELKERGPECAFVEETLLEWIAVNVTETLSTQKTLYSERCRP